MSDIPPSEYQVTSKSKLWDMMRECSGDARVSEEAVETMEGRLQVAVDIVCNYAEEEAYEDDMSTIKSRHICDVFDALWKG